MRKGEGTPAQTKKKTYLSVEKERGAETFRERLWKQLNSLCAEKKGKKRKKDCRKKNTEPGGGGFQY